MNHSRSEIFHSGIGATKELCLRVSAAVLVRVLFENPGNGDLLLALERKAALHETENRREIIVKAQPFGGAIRIQDLSRLRDRIGDFHFDSERSRSEQDFRLFIRPVNWNVVRDFCIQQFSRADDSILETGPGRELAEEFADALRINIKPHQYIHQPVATVIENEATPTENIHAKGTFTTRVYRIFEIRIVDSSLVQAMLKSSESVSDEGLREIALEDAVKGGKGRGNSILVLPLKRIRDVYFAMSPKQRNAPILFEKIRLDETVAAVLDGISVPKYQRL